MKRNTWNRDLKLNCWQRVAVKMIKLGPIPRHIGFIMDGNRRYARNSNLETIKGHEMGFEKLVDCSTICRSLGVCEMTMYALSIENLKRSKEELDRLWDLMEEKLKKLLEEIPEMIKAKSIVRVIGNLDLIPSHLQKLIADLTLEMDKIKDASFTCYLAIAYTSREEITQAMKTILDQVEKGVIELEDIDEDLLEKCLYTSICKYPLGLLIRTSGETRLSDFLLWQSSDAILYFTDVLWPEFTFWDFFKAICKFQQFTVNENRKQNPEKVVVEMTSKRIDSFLKSNQQRKKDEILQYSKLSV